jgi:hypothetical protein
MKWLAFVLGNNFTILIQISDPHCEYGYGTMRPFEYKSMRNQVWIRNTGLSVVNNGSESFTAGSIGLKLQSGSPYFPIPCTYWYFTIFSDEGDRDSDIENGRSWFSSMDLGQERVCHLFLIFTLSF